MYYKVFINHVEIAFAKSTLAGYVEVSKVEDITHFYQHLLDEGDRLNQQQFLVIDPDFSFWKSFKKAHKVINAAGGLVLNNEEKLLVIKRLGCWDLPKGKMENGETPEISALREVEEECGISGMTIKNALPDTYHTYMLKGKRVLKRTYWFNMNYLGTEKLIPQTEEDISEVLFMPENEVKKEALQNTYESLKPLFNAYLARNK